MRLRPYYGKSDYKFVEEWVKDKRVHALWSAGRLPCPLAREALEEFLERDAAEWGGCIRLRRRMARRLDSSAIP